VRAVVAINSSAKKRRRAGVDSDDDDDDDDDDGSGSDGGSDDSDDDVFVFKYREDLFIDDQDRAELMAMPEVKRESILMARAEERDRAYDRYGQRPPTSLNRMEANEGRSPDGCHVGG